jgi:hypothetical protein
MESDLQRDPEQETLARYWKNSSRGETEAFHINTPYKINTIWKHSGVYLALAMQCKSTAASPFTMCMSAGFTTISGAISAGASPVTVNLIKALYSSLPICGLTACALHKHKTLF